MNHQKIEFQKYRDFGQIINATFEFTRLNFGSLIKSVIFIVGPFILLTGIFLGLYQQSIFSIYSITSFSGIGVNIVLLGISLFLTIQTLIAVVYSYMMIYFKMEVPVPIPIEAVWAETKSKFLKVIGISFIIGILGAIIIGIPTVLLAIIFNIQENPLSVFFIFIIIMFPAIYLSIKITLIYIISFNENLGIMDSIKRSFTLTKNKWWFTFGLVFVLSIIQMIMGMIFQIPQWIATFIIAFNSFDGSGMDGSTNIFVIITSVIAALQYLLYAISLIGIAFLYFSLVEQKEAKGLLEKIESL